MQRMHFAAMLLATQRACLERDYRVNSPRTLQGRPAARCYVLLTCLWALTLLLSTLTSDITLTVEHSCTFQVTGCATMQASRICLKPIHKVTTKVHLI